MLSQLRTGPEQETEANGSWWFGSFDKGETKTGESHAYFDAKTDGYFVRGNAYGGGVRFCRGQWWQGWRRWWQRRSFEQQPCEQRNEFFARFVQHAQPEQQFDAAHESAHRQQLEAGNEVRRTAELREPRRAAHAELRQVAEELQERL